MKTTLDIHDELLERAKHHARRTGQPLRALVDEGLRQVLPTETNRKPFRLPDRSVGEWGGIDPLESRHWQDLREVIYGGSGPS